MESYVNLEPLTKSIFQIFSIYNSKLYEILSAKMFLYKCK